jgi:hypothetical protein
MESQIDQRYRLLLLEHYLDSASEVASYGGSKEVEVYLSILWTSGTHRRQEVS